MKFYITDKNVYEELELIDPKFGIDWIADFIGNSGAIADNKCHKNATSYIVWDDEKDAYLIDSDNFEWWKNMVDEMQEFELISYKIEKVYGYDAVCDAIRDSMACDLEYQARNGIEALKAEFPDYF